MDVEACKRKGGIWDSKKEECHLGQSADVEETILRLSVLGDKYPEYKTLMEDTIEILYTRAR